MRSFVFLVALTLTLSTVLSIGPQFPPNWLAGAVLNIVEYQGSWINQDTKWGCDTTNIEEECKVEAAGEETVEYYAADLNCTRSGVPHMKDSEVTDYNIGKTMTVDENNKCVDWDDVDKKKLQPYTIPDGPHTKDEGYVVKDGKKLHKYYYEEMFLSTVMSTHEVYIDDISQKPMPLLVEDDAHITPFGRDLGREFEKYYSFKAWKPDPTLFKVTGIDQCPHRQDQVKSHRHHF